MEVCVQRGVFLRNAVMTEGNVTGDVRRKLTDAIEKDSANMIDRLQHFHERLLGSYPCDRFDLWQDNVRAIGLALQALRAVDRYGVTRRAEQYKGWERLPAPDGDQDSSRTAMILLLKLSGTFEKEVSVSNIDRLYRSAAMKNHPDVGGDPEDFKKLEDAYAIICKHFGIPA